MVNDRLRAGVSDHSLRVDACGYGPDTCRFHMRLARITGALRGPDALRAVNRLSLFALGFALGLGMGLGMGLGLAQTLRRSTRTRRDNR